MSSTFGNCFQSFFAPTTANASATDSTTTTAPARLCSAHSSCHSRSSSVSFLADGGSFGNPLAAVQVGVGHFASPSCNANRPRSSSISRRNFADTGI